MPETPEELFRALGLTVTGTVNQPDPKGKKGPKKQTYALPWAGYQGWRDARARLQHFEQHAKGKVDWALFNDSDSNDGPMSINAYPGRAFIERVTNEGDANLQRHAMTHQGPLPKSPADAAALWFNLGPGALARLDRDEGRELAERTVTVTAFVGDSSDPKDCILDARDYGIGLTGAEMPDTILSLNRGFKKSTPYLTGKHGQGASSTYQYSDLTLIASRKVGARKVAFTLVEGTWDRKNGELPKTPTYRYLTIDGKVPEIELSEEAFPVGTLVRHIGYKASNLFGTLGEQSLYGQLMRSLAEPLFPIWYQMYTLRPGTAYGYPVAPGYRRYRRLIRGTVNTLERAWAASLKSEGPQQAAEIEEDEDEPKAKLLHRASEYYQLPKWDLGGREGIIELGRVKINYWVADPAGRRPQDVVKNWVDPEKTILMTLDGQTHAEESKNFITGQTGAQLWAVGKYMVVQIDCNGLDYRASYELFPSTREHAKDTPIKAMIMEELVRRLGFDTKLAELNVHMAAADIKQPMDEAENISKLIKKYLKNMGVSFEQFKHRLVKWTEVDVEKEVPVSKPQPAPIEPQEPPTFVRWKFGGTVIKLYPGQKYSYVFETDAAPSYWNPADPSTSKIKVLSYGIRYVGAGEMLGGRVRCHFECPEDQTVGAKGFIQVQLDYAIGQSKHHRVPVEVVEKPKPRPKPEPTPPNDKELDDGGELTKTVTVKIKKKDFTEVEIPVVKPIPVGQTDPTWLTLGWPLDPHRVGFSIRSVSGRVFLYYNKEFPPFLDLRRQMSKKSLEGEFQRRYEVKLILHTIFTLNYDFVDEDEFKDEQRKQVRDLLCATAESLALATKSEIEIEAKVKSEDGAMVGTPSDLQEVSGPAEALVSAAGES